MSERPRVLLVREQVEDREIANYVSLSELFDLRIVTAARPAPYEGTGLDLPQINLPCIANHRLGRRVARLIADHVPLVDLDALVGFERHARSARLLFVNETHLVSSAQAARVRRAYPNVRLVAACFENIPFNYENDVRLARRKDAVRAACDAFVAVTPSARDALVAEGVDASRVSVITLGVDAEQFAARARSDTIRRRWGAAPEDVVVLYAGRLVREKGLTLLLRAAADLPTGALRVVIAGDGPEKQALHRVVHALGIGDRVVFEGWQPRRDMPALLASSDIFAMPSLTAPYWEEQLGFSMIEAMACAVPVVATDSGAIPYVLGGGGITIRPYSVPALSAALCRLAGDRAQRLQLGLEGRRRVVESVNSDVASAALASLFATLLPL
jgi:glycosyltransferase involved in cell wall biosynthesis